MATLTAAFDTNEQIGIKEDIEDKIFMISPKETPFLSNAQKLTARNTLHQWQTDTLRSPVENRQVEGNTAAASARTPTTMLNNYTCISDDVFAVTGTADAVDTYGRAKESIYQRVKAGLQLKTDMEITLLANDAKNGQSSSASARVAAGFPTWITNYTNGTGPTSGTGSSIAVASSATALTYEFLSSAMQLVYQAGGNPSIMMLPPGLKRKFSLLTIGSSSPSTADIRYDISTPKAAAAVGTVDQWLSDFGMLDVTPNRQQALGDTFLQQAVFLIDPEKYGVAFLRPLQFIPLAKVGDYEQELVLAEYTLVVQSPKAHGAVWGMT